MHCHQIHSQQARSLLSLQFLLTNITTSARPSSVSNPALLALKEHNVKIVAVDLDGPGAKLADELAGLHIVIYAIDGGHLLFTTNGGGVVRLGRVRDAKVVGQLDALGGQVSEVG
jgi:hypothetical protein